MDLEDGWIAEMEDGWIMRVGTIIIIDCWLAIKNLFLHRYWMKKTIHASPSICPLDLCKKQLPFLLQHYFLLSFTVVG